jgi:hypothetical protein
VTVSATGHVTQGYPVAEYNKSSTDHLWWEFKDGSQTTANTYLTGKFGSRCGPAVAERHDRPAGAVPDADGADQRRAVDGLPVLHGGVPGHPALRSAARQHGRRLGRAAVRHVPSTYAFSDNPMVFIYNIPAGIHDSGGTFVWGGRYSAYQMPYTEWAAAMNACDTVDLAGRRRHGEALPRRPRDLRQRGAGRRHQGIC